MLVICIICSGACNVNKEKISVFQLRISAKTMYMHIALHALILVSRSLIYSTIMCYVLILQVCDGDYWMTMYIS